MKLGTKKAITPLIKAGDTETIIKLYEIDAVKNQLTAFDVVKAMDDLTPLQKITALKEIKSSRSLGLIELKDYFKQLLFDNLQTRLSRYELQYNEITFLKGQK
jgi:ribosomal protein L7/L12